MSYSRMTHTFLEVHAVPLLYTFIGLTIYYSLRAIYGRELCARFCHQIRIWSLPEWQKKLRTNLTYLRAVSAANGVQSYYCKFCNCFETFDFDISKESERGAQKYEDEAAREAKTAPKRSWVWRAYDWFFPPKAPTPMRDWVNASNTFKCSQRVNECLSNSSDAAQLFGQTPQNTSYKPSMSCPPNNMFIGELHSRHHDRDLDELVDDYQQNDLKIYD